MARYLGAEVIDLRLGRWQDALADVREVDALICDPPYGARTHRGHDSGGPQILGVTGQATRQALSYGAWGAEDVAELVDSWAPRTRGWVVALTSHDLIPHWEVALVRHGRYVFAPLPVIMHRPRLLGDGPASSAVWCVVARPRTREAARWGCLPGWYRPDKELGAHIGGKPLGLMRALVGDYTDPGALVCDPCAGYGTTLLAAAELGCRAVGAEVDPETFAHAQKRIARGYTVGMHPRAERPRGEQGDLW